MMRQDSWTGDWNYCDDPKPHLPHRHKKGKNEYSCIGRFETRTDGGDRAS